MSWWGKALGGAFGFMFGGPVGALLGAALGHTVDRNLGAAPADQNDNAEQEHIQTIFFTATFSVMGHIAKVDGRVSEDEIALARRVMSHMRLSEDQKQTAIRLFAAGKNADFPLDDLLVQFRHACRRRPQLVQMFLEVLISTALADGALQPRETAVLHRICLQLGVPRAQLDSLIQTITAAQHAADNPSAKPSPDRLADAYAMLGITEQASDDAVTRAYRRLMSKHHPDKLVAKGLPEEMLKLATSKTQQIKAAYEQVRRARGLTS